MTIDSSQGDEYQIIFVSLVTTKNQAGFMGTRFRACVGTSRQMEALYFVGKADYWFTRIEGGFKYLHNILKHIRDNRLAWNQPPFIVGTPTQASLATALPIHEGKGKGKGKGKEADASDPVTVPASEQLKTFVQKADEKRKAAIAAGEAVLAAMDTKFSAERAKVEQEQAESLRLLNEDIAAEEGGLRFEAQMEGS